LNNKQLFYLALSSIVIILILSILIFALKGNFGIGYSVVESTVHVEDWPTPKPTSTATCTLTPFPTVTPPPTMTPIPTATITPLPTPIVVDIHEFGNLTTIEYKTQVMVERVRQGGFLNIGEKRIFLLAVGMVEAGIDMSNLDDDAIQVNGTSVSLVLPHATITRVESLPDESRVYDASGGWWPFANYDGLELEALDQARTQMRDWAVTETNILATAEQVATAQLRDFLYQLGFQKVDITYKTN